ncbi:MAG: nucleotidyl transferase AbiEii/AbiGii toxin family protein, partial [Myxococcota bacterium]
YFTGGSHFSRNSLSVMGQALMQSLSEKYSLDVVVSEPIKDTKNVSTWKIKIQTKPKQKQLPAQRIHIDICAVPSYEKQPMMLLNPYGVDMGTDGLIVQAQSREEIYADKLLAFALRPNRLKHRDIWDMVWLHQKGCKPRLKLIPSKLQDRNLTLKHFFKRFAERCESLTDQATVLAFQKELHRFLPLEQIHEIVEQDNLWDFVIYLMHDLQAQLRHSLAK